MKGKVSSDRANKSTLGKEQRYSGNVKIPEVATAGVEKLSMLQWQE